MEKGRPQGFNGENDEKRLDFGDKPIRLDEDLEPSNIGIYIYIYTYIYIYI